MAQPPPFENPSWVAPHLSYQYSLEAVPQRQARFQHGVQYARTISAVPFGNLASHASLLRYCDDCGQRLPEVFDAKNHKIQPSHANILELTEREVLAMQEEQKKAELDFLRQNVAAGAKENNPVIPPGHEGRNQNAGTGTTSETPRVTGYQGLQGERKILAGTQITIDNTPVRTNTPTTYTAATIPGLGPIPYPISPSRDTNKIEQLRQQNKYLQSQLSDLKTTVWERIGAIEGDMKSFKSDTKMRELKMSILMKQRDDARAELDILKNGNASSYMSVSQGAPGGEQGNGQEEPQGGDADLDMDVAG